MIRSNRPESIVKICFEFNVWKHGLDYLRDSFHRSNFRDKKTMRIFHPSRRYLIHFIWISNKHGHLFKYDRQSTIAQTFVKNISEGKNKICLCNEISFQQYFRISMQVRSIISVLTIVCLVIVTFFCSAVGMRSLVSKEIVHFFGVHLL